MTYTPTPTPAPQREQSIRVPVLWGLAFGAIQAASPLALWWLDQATVQSLLLTLIAAVYIGFAADHSWIDIHEAKDGQGHIVHQRGVTPSPGLYMRGLTWQHTRGSALLGWVGSDAAFLAGQITSLQG